MGQDGCGMLLLLLCWRWGFVHRRWATTGQSRSKDRDVDRGDDGSISFRVRARWVKQKDLINWKMCVRTGEDALNDAFDGSFANGSGISGLKPRGHNWRVLSITDQIAA